MNSIDRSLFAHRIQAICNEMGAVIQATALSPNIRDRLDYSCAIFDAKGHLCAQAAHIPVHLGSMAYAMESIVERISWQQGDVIVLNDPYLGGTHLPDITVISPVFVDKILFGFVVNRAHHADIGSETPGSMPISTTLQQEGLVIPPTHLVSASVLQTDNLKAITQQLHNPQHSEADFQSQISTNLRGVMLLNHLIIKTGKDVYMECIVELNDYAEQLARNGIKQISNGQYTFNDIMDDDGMGSQDIPIHVTLTIKDGSACVDFTHSGTQVSGNINCPLSVTAAAVYYCFYCLMPRETPACAGAFRPITLIAPEGSFLNASRPAAVAAGNVETSMRIVDTVLGALSQAIPTAIPAASQGSMNNVAMGTEHWDYYETIAGGMGASSLFNGVHAQQSHMTNTLNTPVEVLEMHYPLRINKYQIRHGSGGEGTNHGGDGIIREFQFLDQTSVSLLTERRRHNPWGLHGGKAGKNGLNLLNGTQLDSKVSLTANPGDVLTVHTPGGGGWGIT
jgi:N-methylhydantoinase B